MPCLYDEPPRDYAQEQREKDLHQILSLLDELMTGELNLKHFRGAHPKVADLGTSSHVLNQKTAELCKALQLTDDVKRYSPEIQIWWRDHQEADRKRLEKEMRKAEKDKAREEARAKLTPYERELLGIK